MNRKIILCALAATMSLPLASTAYADDHEAGAGTGADPSTTTASTDATAPNTDATATTTDAAGIVGTALLPGDGTIQPLPVREPLFGLDFSSQQIHNVINKEHSNFDANNGKGAITDGTQVNGDQMTESKKYGTVVTVGDAAIDEAQQASHGSQNLDDGSQMAQDDVQNAGHDLVDGDHNVNGGSQLNTTTATDTQTLTSETNSALANEGSQINNLHNNTGAINQAEDSKNTGLDNTAYREAGRDIMDNTNVILNGSGNMATNSGTQEINDVGHNLLDNSGSNQVVSGDTNVSNQGQDIRNAGRNITEFHNGMGGGFPDYYYDASHTSADYPYGWGRGAGAMIDETAIDSSIATGEHSNALTGGSQQFNLSGSATSTIANDESQIVSGDFANNQPTKSIAGDHKAVSPVADSIWTWQHWENITLVIASAV
jgi:hypothetical protein